MTFLHRVKVYWSDEKMAELPTSGQYITVARFQEDKASWPLNAWSVVLRIRGDVHAQPCEADVRFLSPQAPHERFKSGVKFELLEGNRKTAIVHVL